jgi:isoleucyl-tRNA synthetase
VLAVWKPLLEAREAALKALETARAAKTIASSLEATLRFKGPARSLAPLRAHESKNAPFPGNLANLFIVSRVVLEESDGAALTVEVARAEGIKCSRCWTYAPAGTSGAPEDPRGALCPRCTDVVLAVSAR